MDIKENQKINVAKAQLRGDKWGIGKHYKGSNLGLTILCYKLTRIPILL